MMEALTKKRLKASLIDSVISGLVSAGAEYFLRKKIKNEALYNVVLPIATQYTLEYIQLKNSGQTIGYKLMGLRLESEDGGELSGNQIVKRMVHRDTTSSFEYFLNRKGFEEKAGQVFPHDKRTGTIVKEIS